MKRFAVWLLMPLLLVFFSGVFHMPAPAYSADDGHAAHAETAHEGGAGHGNPEEGADHHASGPPLEPEPDLALFAGIAFALLLFVLWKYAWTPLIAGLDKRERRVRDDIAAAESARVKAEQLLAEHQGKLEAVQEEIREILAEARRDAEHTKNEIISAAQREADANKERAVREIERAKRQALSEIFDQMTQNVTVATEHVLGRSLTEADQDRLVEEALAQLSGQNGHARW